MSTTGNHRSAGNGDRASADTTDRSAHGLAGTEAKTPPGVPLSGAAHTPTTTSLAAGFGKAVLSFAILCATPVSFGALYLMYLGSIPSCSDRAWYNCPPDPVATTGIVLAGLAVLVVAIAALVTVWSPRKRRH